MLNTSTHQEENRLVWSPDGDKLAYITEDGLHAYVVDDATGEEETYLHLSNLEFEEIAWSPSGDYLSAATANGRTVVYHFEGEAVSVVYTTRATTVEWIDADAFACVPYSGGLVVVRLAPSPVEISLAP